MTRPNLSLGIPDLKAFAVKTPRSPIIRVNQAHRVSRCDREPASIAGVSEAGTVPKLNRAVTREATIFNPVPNELPKDIRDHIDKISILIFQLIRRARCSEARLTTPASGTLAPDQPCLARDLN